MLLPTRYHSWYFLKFDTFSNQISFVIFPGFWYFVQLGMIFDISWVLMLLPTRYHSWYFLSFDASSNQIWFLILLKIWYFLTAKPPAMCYSCKTENMLTVQQQLTHYGGLLTLLTFNFSKFRKHVFLQHRQLT